MSLRSKFLAYVEYQRAAEEAYYVEGSLSSNAKSMFAEANRRKTELLEMMDKLEVFDHAIDSTLELDPDKRDWYYDGDGTRRKKDE